MAVEVIHAGVDMVAGSAATEEVRAERLRYAKTARLVADPVRAVIRVTSNVLTVNSTDTLPQSARTSGVRRRLISLAPMMKNQCYY